jgi:hypothetical protein
MPRKRCRAKDVTDVRELARVHTKQCLHVLSRIICCPKAQPSARVQACVIMLNRGWGSPPQEVTAKVEGTHTIRWIDV